MAKELLIVFVYDCEMCKKEEDDPEEAIVYFYPAWVNREQRHALCSQLMGVTQFCNSAFSNPRIISLQSGKFSVKKLSRYYLCVGTDRNIPDIVLETRSKTLFRLIRLFHYDIETLHASLPDDSEYTLTDRLTELFQVYTPILQYATNIFGNIPTFKLPKSASSLFLQAMHILQNLQKLPGVLGGVFLHQNKVIATQLSHQLTKQFVATDPHRIKLPADTITTTFHLPIGVQLLSIYVDAKEIARLRETLDTLHRAISLVPQWRKEYEAAVSKMETKTGSSGGSKGGESVSTGVSVSEGMKRSKSSMFTLPEEGFSIPPTNGNVESPVAREDESEKAGVPDVVKDAVRARHMARIQGIKPADYVMKQAVAPAVPRPKSVDSLLNKSTHPMIPLRYYSFGLPKLSDDDYSSDNGSHPTYYNTITDPVYPVFKESGMPCSIYMFRSRLKDLYSGLTSKPPKPKLRPKSIALSKEETVKEVKSSRPKRDFKLPLNTNTESTSTRWGSGVAVTPLMAKLSILAMEEESVGAGTPLGTVTTPIGQKSTARTPLRPPLRPIPLSEQQTKQPVTAVPSQMSSSVSRHRRRFSDNETESLVNTVLYVFGQGTTVVLALLDHSTATNPEYVHFLWENCVRDVTEYEEKLGGALRGAAAGPDPSTLQGDENAYSYMLVDPGWGPTDRSGTYRPQHIEILTDLHNSLNLNPNMTDITLRSEEAVWYGYQCGGRQVYYQESCTGGLAGLPPPTDAMAVVPLKARRRLERDHNILIL